LIATHQERTLLLTAVSILVLNLALNRALIPIYGYRVAAITSVASEACSLAIAGIAVHRKVGFRPRLDYLPVLFLAGVVMTAVMLVLPIQRLAAAAVAGTIYVVLLVLLPGTVRLTARELASASFAAYSRRRQENSGS
jgi:O-antigen/teichoic acid export membrane protein